MPNPTLSTHSNTAATTVPPQHPDTAYFRRPIAYVSSYFVNSGNSSATSSDAAMPSTAAAHGLLSSAQSIMTNPIVNATRNLFKSAVGSDLLIEVGSEMVPAHQAIVLCRSSMLAKEYSHLWGRHIGKMLGAKPCLTLGIKDHEDAIMCFLEYIYTGRYAGMPGTTGGPTTPLERLKLHIKVYAVAIIYEVPDLQKTVEDLFTETTLFSGIEQADLRDVFDMLDSYPPTVAEAVVDELFETIAVAADAIMEDEDEDERYGPTCPDEQ